MGPNTCGTSSIFFRTRISLRPRVRRILDGSISMLFPAMRRAQVPFGISKITSRDVDLMGDNAAHPVAPTAIPSNKIDNQRTYLIGLSLNSCGKQRRLLLQQNVDVMGEIVGAVPIWHQGAQAAVTIYQIDV